MEGGQTRFSALRVAPELARDLERYGVRFRGVVESTFLRDLLSWVAPAVVFVAIWMFAMRRMAGQQGVGFLAVGKSRAKVYAETDTKVTFADVAGVDEAKDELREVVGFVKDPTGYGRLGARLPKGVLLVGLPGTGPVQKVSIIPRGVGILGYTIQRPIEDRFVMTAQELEHKMMALLGSPPAEQLVFGQLPTGGADDVVRVTDIARAMVMRYGMHERLGAVSYAPERPSFLGAPQLAAGREYGEETAREIDRAVREIVAVGLERALGLLREHRAVLEHGAGQLLEHETLRGEELAQLRAALAPDAATRPASAGA